MNAAIHFLVPVVVALLASALLVVVVTVLGTSPPSAAPAVPAHAHRVYTEKLDDSAELDAYELANGDCLYVVWGKMSAPAAAVSGTRCR